MRRPASIATERRKVTDRSGKGDVFGFVCADCTLASSFEMLPPNSIFKWKTQKLQFWKHPPFVLLTNQCQEKNFLHLKQLIKSSADGNRLSDKCFPAVIGCRTDIYFHPLKSFHSTRRSQAWNILDLPQTSGRWPEVWGKIVKSLLTLTVVREWISSQHP